MSKSGYYTNLLSATDGRPTAWRVEERPTTGTMVYTLGGTPLFRAGRGCIYLWDKYEKAEVQMSIEALVGLVS